AVPGFAVAGETRRDEGNPPVDGVHHGLAVRIEVMCCRLGPAAEDMVEAAGDQQSGEGAQETKAALALRFVQSGMPESGRRMPTDSRSAILAVADVEGAIDEDREAETGAGAELEDPHAALDAVTEGHETHAGKLGKHAAVAGGVTA